LYEEPLGSHFIWAGFDVTGRSEIRVDFQRLILEWIVIIVLVSALLVTLSRRKE
jgi:hypothetical protein